MFWESSRIILPEHKAAINSHRRQLGKKERPCLDAQRIEELEYVLRDSISERSEVDIVVFGDFEDSTIRGVVLDVDVRMKRIKVQIDEDDFSWVPLGDVIDVYKN